MRTAEDVKLRPIPGDVLRGFDSSGSTEMKRVLRNLGHRVEYLDYMDEESEDVGIVDQCYIEHGWRRWSATAEVIHIAQPKEKTDG